LLPELNAFDAFINMVGFLFTVITILGLGFSLLNIMNMIVQERTHEIGMLRAIGQSRLNIFSMLLKEAGILMAIGSMSGICLGIVFINMASKHGISISKGLDMLGIRPVIYPSLNAGLLVMILVISTVLTLLISSIPAYRAMQTKPSAASKD
jgi:putative ABC transport system permease protein